MRAAVLHAANEPLTIEDIQITKPKRREVLIRTAYAGLCHSDLHFMEGLYPHPVPVVLGHESAGVVEQVGADVTYAKPGDHVVTCLSVFCGTCDNCTTGRPVLCTNTEVKYPPGVSRRLSWGRAEPLHQFLNLSSFAEQIGKSLGKKTLPAKPPAPPDTPTSSIGAPSGLIDPVELELLSQATALETRQHQGDSVTDPAMNSAEGAEVESLISHLDVGSMAVEIDSESAPGAAPLGLTPTICRLHPACRLRAPTD